MKIFVTGTRGIPNIPGGVEKHCQELYPIISSLGHEIILATRSSYVEQNIEEWNGVKLVKCYAPKIKSMEAIIHTLIALIKARWYSPDVVHVHAVGPALLIPFARLLGLKVVFTNHGPDYDRQKWNGIAKAVLRIGEKVGGIFAHEIIVISNVIKKIILKRCNRNANLIYNGVPVPKKSDKTDYLDQVGVKPHEYIIAVARFVPEKGLHNLIEAFKTLDTDLKLVIAGDADHETEYSHELKEIASTDSRIILTGYITGETLNQIFSYANLFVLPSYHEGLPIALLEAMSYGLPVLVSDIPANMEVGLSKHRYFKCGDIYDLKNKMANILKSEISEIEKSEIENQIKTNYNWREIAIKTVNVYKRVPKYS
ncbi:MAG: glycosyltransferase family 4 protein [Desulfobacterales bacterium]|nr:glycosyltransferase family 4 protein [Desulfobacterales bacterium]